MDIVVDLVVPADDAGSGTCPLNVNLTERC